MKTIENFFIQSLLLSLTSQLAWTLAINNEETRSQAPSSQGIVGTLYRSAALKASDKEALDAPVGSSRGQRCVRCGSNGYANGYAGGYGGYTDRYDDYYYRDYYRGREDPLYYGRDPYYRDRNWYYQPESRYQYTDPRYPNERPPYTAGRYDDRYYARTNTYDYDPYYYNSYRGNGYDNLNPSYYEAMRDRFQRDRSYGYDQYYDRYDRPSYRGYYDNRNFRPYDETYSGTSGFDNSGRGYYFSNELGPPFDPQSPPHYRPPPPPPHPNFYEQSHRPQSPNRPSSQSHHQYSPHTTPLIPPEYYQGKPAHSPSSSSSTSSSSSSNKNNNSNNNSNTQTVSSNTIGVDSGGSATSNNNKNNSNKELDNKDKASTSYGGRPQSLGSSYLFERTDDEVNPGSGLNPPIAADTKKPESANLEMKSE